MKSDRTKNVKNAASCTSVHGFPSQVSQSIENLISFFALSAAAKWLKGTQNRLEIGSHFPDDREFAPTARKLAYQVRPPIVLGKISASFPEC